MRLSRLLAPLRGLTTVRYPYEDPTAKRRARFLILFSVALFVVLLLVTVFVSLPNTRPDIDTWVMFGLQMITYVIPVPAIGYFLAQTGRWRASAIFLTTILFGFTVLFVRASGIDRSSILVYSLVVLMASALLGTRALAISVLASAGSIVIIREWQATGAFILDRYDFDPILVGVMVLIVDGLILWYFSRDRDISLNEAQRASHRLRAAGLVSQTAISTLDLNTMLEQIVDQIHDEFDLYHVQIFLIDEDGNDAVLRASTGEAGQSLLDRGHRLAVGSQSVIGRVTETGQPVLASDTSVDEVHRRNEFLPDTRTELAVPVQLGNQVIGALDLQSREPEAFNAQDIEAFQVMANQLAAAIDNARLFAEQTRRAAESEVLLREAEVNLREIERLNRQLTRRAWTEYLRSRGRDVMGITFSNEQPRVDTAWTPGMVRAARQSAPVAEGDDERHLVAVPVLLRDTVIGAIEVESETAEYTEDMVEVAQAVADRLAVTIENVRLVDRSQRLADRESQVGEIATALQQQTSVDDMLATAVSELSRLLGAERASIRLGMRQEAGAIAIEDADSRVTGR